MIKRIIYLLVLLLNGCDRPEPASSPEKAPERIISMSPNITDTLLDLGLESRLVGVSRFSGTDEVSTLPVIGDFMTINYEAVVALKPDLVILEKSSDEQKNRLRTLGIPYLETGSLTLAEIMESIRRIGEACDAQPEADQLIRQLHQQIDALRNTPRHRPRTLMVFSDYSNHEQVEQVFAFGAHCIHSELLEIAGGDNIITNSTPSVTLSREAILRLNPELIIELSAGGPRNNWSNLTSVDAVKNRRIHVLDGTYTTIPSPGSITRTLKDFSEIIRQDGTPE